MIMIRRMDKKAMGPDLVVILAAILFTFILILVFIYSGWFDNFNILESHNTKENTFSFIQECGVLCVDRNATEFCATEKELRLGNGKSVKASCGQVSGMGIAGFDGVPECQHFSCNTLEDSKCFDGRREVDCVEFSKEGFLTNKNT